MLRICHKRTTQANVCGSVSVCIVWVFVSLWEYVRVCTVWVCVRVCLSVCVCIVWVCLSLWENVCASMFSTSLNIPLMVFLTVLTRYTMQSNHWNVFLLSLLSAGESEERGKRLKHLVILCFCLCTAGRVENKSCPSEIFIEPYLNTVVGSALLSTQYAGENQIKTHWPHSYIWMQTQMQFQCTHTHLKWSICLC